MNYSSEKSYGRKIVSSNSPRKTRQKSLIWLLVIPLVVGLLLGYIGTAIFNRAADQAPPPQYGTLDGKVFDGEMSQDWSSGAELGFVPVNCGLDEAVQEFIYCLSYGYNIDYAFVMGLIEKESGFQADIISKTNDYGLMQINTINHDWMAEQFGITDFLDPYQNTRAGLFILRKLFEKYEDPTKVLMAYNMGEYGASKLWDKGIYETNYTKSVMEKAFTFADELERNDEND